MVQKHKNLSSIPPTRILVVLVDRANYGRLKPLMNAIASNPKLSLEVLCSGTMVLDRFGKTSEAVKSDGFNVVSETYIELEGSNNATMSKSLGLSIIEFTSEFKRIQPDFILLIGDRYEALGAAIAASYSNFCLIHVQGGEVSNSIDESARHCITKLSHYHFPCTERSAEFLVRMGEAEETVFNFGCTSGDIAKSLDFSLPSSIFEKALGAKPSPNKPFALVVFHPVTTKLEEIDAEITQVIDACSKLKLQVIWLWPNIDAGSDIIGSTLRRFREQSDASWLSLFKNFSPENYLRVLNSASVAIGNSSSFVRDSSFLGTPVVLVGDRQNGREYSSNVRQVDCFSDDILSATLSQIEHGKYPISTLYGDGTASEKIANKICELKKYKQKIISYV